MSGIAVLKRPGWEPGVPPQSQQLEGKKLYMLMTRVFLSSRVGLTRNALLALCGGLLTQGPLRSILGHQ